MTSSPRAELEALLQRLAYLLRQGASADAESLATNGRKEFPLSGELVRLHGIALLQMGRRREALTALHRAAELAPASLEVQCNLADVALQDGRPEAAIERLQAALGRAPGHPGVLQGSVGEREHGCGRDDAAGHGVREAGDVASGIPHEHVAGQRSSLSRETI